MKQLARLGFLIVFGVFLAACSQSVSTYAVVLDAGSSGTRVYVYSVEKRAAGSVPKVVSLSSCKDANPSATVPAPGCKQSAKDVGIASLANATQAEIDAYLAPMIAFAKAQIPASSVASTPIYLRATAGVRNLTPASLQDILMAKATISLGASGFVSKNAEVIEGTAEALYAWVNANGIKGMLGSAPNAMTGIIEIGGASEQIAFVTAPPTATGVTLGGQVYNLYTYSYNHLGVNEALAVPVAACDTQGAATDYAACKTGWNSVLNENQFCTPLCGLEGVSQPLISGQFLLLGASPASTINGCNISPINADTIDAKAAAFCAASPDSLTPYTASAAQKAICPGLGADDFYSSACKLLALISAELSGQADTTFKGYGFPSNTTNISAADSKGNIDGQEATWTRGLLILEFS